MEYVLGSIFWSCIFYATWMDWRTSEVYNFLWWIAGAASHYPDLGEGDGQSGAFIALGNFLRDSAFAVFPHVWESGLLRFLRLCPVWEWKGLGVL